MIHLKVVPILQGSKQELIIVGSSCQHCGKHKSVPTYLKPKFGSEFLKKNPKNSSLYEEVYAK